MTTLKKQVEQVWNIDPETTNYVPPTLYPATGGPRYRNPIQQIIIKHESKEDGFGAAAANATTNGGAGGFGGNNGGATVGGGAFTGGQTSNEGRVVKDLILENVGTLPGSVVPEGFQHYSHCSCF